jgi:hypothetical protein
MEPFLCLSWGLAIDLKPGIDVQAGMSGGLGMPNASRYLEPGHTNHLCMAVGTERNT